MNGDDGGPGQHEPYREASNLVLCVLSSPPPELPCIALVAVADHLPGMHGLGQGLARTSSGEEEMKLRKQRQMSSYRIYSHPVGEGRADLMAWDGRAVRLCQVERWVAIVRARYRTAATRQASTACTARFLPPFWLHFSCCQPRATSSTTGY